MSFVYFSDSCCDLPTSYTKKRDLHLLALTYKIGDREITQIDDPTMPSQEFYRLIRQGVPSGTSQINIAVFEEAFRKVLEKGDDILYLAFSSALSGTCQSAIAARDHLLQDFPEREILILDTKQASLGSGLMVHYALNLRDEGKSAHEVYAWMEEHRQNFNAWFTASDLAHLRRGGRISATSAFLGTMLNIKPVMHVDAEGFLIPREKVKGRARSLKALVDHMESSAIDPANQTVFLTHSDNLADAQSVVDQIKERMGTTDFMISDIGPVIGSHTGGDTIALFFFGKDRG